MLRYPFDLTLEGMMYEQANESQQKLFHVRPLTILSNSDPFFNCIGGPWGSQDIGSQLFWADARVNKFIRFASSNKKLDGYGNVR